MVCLCRKVERGLWAWVCTKGVFKEDKSGYIKISNTKWDYKPGVLFVKLLEFEALKNHYTGKENWKNSRFAMRNVNFIKKNNKLLGMVSIGDVVGRLVEKYKKPKIYFRYCN